ncbi:MAG: hypothetical protein ACJ8J0_14075 [Longimicrobiaceae bacterium]
MILFLLPFGGLGAFAAMGALQLAGKGDTHGALLTGYIGILFGAVGFGGIAFLLANRRKMLELAALEEATPDAPWLWRPEWAAGQLAYPTRVRLRLIWIFAAFWNFFTDPIAFLLLREGRANPWMLLLPLVGVLLLVQAVRATLRFRRYGVSRLDLSTVPGVVGKSLEGVLRVPARLRPPDGFRAVLTCTLIRTSGDSSTRSILWQEERSIPGEAGGTAAAPETRIPIAFDLPFDVRPYDTRHAPERVVWNLRVSARVPGVDYEAEFDVPVFRTAETEEGREVAARRWEAAALRRGALPTRGTDPAAGPGEGVARSPFGTGIDATAERAERRTEALPAGVHGPPAGSRMVVTRGPCRTEVYVPAARNPRHAFVVTVAAPLMGAFAAYLARSGAPVVFPAFFGLFAVLYLYGALDLWLTVTRVVVRPEALTWASGFLAPGRERTLLAVQIADVTATVGVPNGYTAYHDVAVVRTNGRKVFLARYFRDKPEAEWLASEIRRVLADPG